MAERKKRKGPVIAAVLFVIVFLAGLLYSTTGTSKYKCEVCITYNGRTDCRTGAAATQAEAQRIATDVVCAQISSGMSEGIQCRGTNPDRVTWK